MKEGLVTLLVRKTDESRRNAQNHVESWRKAIDAVREAEKHAECTIPLPSSLTVPVSVAVQEARVASHIVAIDLTKNASLARTDVLTFATNTLEQEIESRSEAITRAKEAMKWHENSRDMKLRDAERAKSHAISSANDALSSVEYSCSSIKMDTDPFNNMKSCLDGGIFGLIIILPFEVFALLSALVSYLLKKAIAVPNVNAKRQEFDFVARQAEDAFAQSRKQIEREFSACLPEREQAIKKAEALKNKADTALRLFQAKA